MKRHFVRTGNYDLLIAGVGFMEDAARGASSCLFSLTGDPGTGKTANIDHWGARVGAVMVKGHVGMNLQGLRWAVGAALGIGAKRNPTEEVMAQIAALKSGHQPIVFDEAQYGVVMQYKGVKAAGIEYLRDLAERANTYVVLVTHTSEVSALSEFAHIRTRIANRINMLEASLADVGEFLARLCDVPVSPGVVAMVHQQSGGKPRLLENAIQTLEKLASARALAKLDVPDLAGITLIVDHEKGLRPKLTAVRKTAGKAIAGKTGEAV